MRADYHVHTEFSDDSTEKMEDQVLQGIRIGLNEICFTDHVDYGIKKDWDQEAEFQYRGGDGIGTSKDELSPMANVNYPLYFAETERLKRKYGSQITIRSGLEFGIQSHTVPQFEKLYETYRNRLDFVLISMHQVNDQEFWNQEFMKGRSQKEYNEAYYREIYETMKLFDHYNVMAHLDLIVRYDPAGVYPFEKYQDMVAEILRLAIAQGKGIEINTSSWHYGLTDTQPSRAILRLYKDLGGKIITIGSDAHQTKRLGEHFQRAASILKDEIGFEKFCTFDHMEPVFHCLCDAICYNDSTGR